MIQVSEKAAAVIESDSRRFRSRFLLSGTLISGEVRSVKTHKGSCGETQFAPGMIFSSYLDVVLDYCQESLEGKELLYQIGVVIDEENTEWYDIGYFAVCKPSKSVYTTSFQAIGRISARMGGLYSSNLAFPASIQSVLDEISTATGVEIDASEFDTSGMIETKPVGYMHREVLAFIAGIFMGYATEDTSGKVVISRYKTVGNIVETDGDRTTILPTFADLDTEITGIKVIVSDNYLNDSEEESEESEETENEISYESGTVNIAVSNPLMTKELFDANVNNLIGLTYRSGTVSISMGDFRIEPFDCMKVTDSAGYVRLVPCMSVMHTFESGFTTEIIAPGIENEEGEETSFRGALGKMVKLISADLIVAKKAILKSLTVEDLRTRKLTAENLHITGESTFDGEVTASLLNVYQKFDYTYDGETLPYAFVVNTSHGDYPSTRIGTYCVDEAYLGLNGSFADFGANGYMNLYSSDNMTIHSETNVNISAGIGCISLGGDTTIDGSITANSRITLRQNSGTAGHGIGVRNDSYGVQLLVGSGGKTHGLWENNYAKDTSGWIIYRDGDSDVAIVPSPLKCRTAGGTSIYPCVCTSGAETTLTNYINNSVSTDGYPYLIVGGRWGSSSNASKNIRSATTASDKRVKDDLGLMDTEEALTMLRGLDVINFRYKNAEDKESYSNGFYAQDVRDLLIKNDYGYKPYLIMDSAKENEYGELEVFTDLLVDEDKVQYSLDYGKFTPILWKGWQYHDDRIHKLESRIIELEKQLQASA